MMRAGWVRWEERLAVTRATNNLEGERERGRGGAARGGGAEEVVVV